MEFNVIVSLILLAALSAGLYFYDRMHTKLSKANKELTYNNAVINMETKAFRVQMNPHFIYNSFSAVQYLIMINENDKAFNYLSDFSLLMRQMFENARKQYVQLSEEIEFLERYIELEKIRFSNSFVSSIHTENITNTRNYKIPTMMVQPIVENAIRHGLAPKKQNGVLDITFIANKDYITCKIEDNGIGLKKDLLITSLGDESALKIIKERLDLINSYYNKKAELTIINREDDLGENSGVIVELILPFRDNS